MSLYFSPSLRQARASAIVTDFDKAATAGRIEIYATTQPAGGEAAGGSPMVTIPLQKPCGTATGGVLTFATTSPGQINPGGTALWARGFDGDSNWVIDGDLAVTGTPGAVFTLDDPVLLLGGFIFLSGATLTEP